MIGWLLAVTMASAGPLMHIIPPEHGAIGVQVDDFWIPRGTTVQPREGSCPHETVPVTVLVVDPWYRIKDVRLPSTGQAVCVRAAVLRSLGEPDGDERAERAVGAAYFRHFGPIDADAIKSTPWGRVALPLPRELSDKQLAEEWSSEHLVTPQQRTRATVAEGPRRQGEPVYTHFLGTARRGLTALTRVCCRAAGTGQRLVDPAWSGYPAGCMHRREPHRTVRRFGLVQRQASDPLGHKAHFEATVSTFVCLGTMALDTRHGGIRRRSARGERWLQSGARHRAGTPANHKPTKVYFNDPEVHAAVPGVEAQPGHDDHIHLCF